MLCVCSVYRQDSAKLSHTITATSNMRATRVARREWLDSFDVAPTPPYLLSYYYLYYLLSEPREAAGDTGSSSTIAGGGL